MHFLINPEKASCLVDFLHEPVLFQVLPKSSFMSSSDDLTRYLLLLSPVYRWDN